MKTSDVVDVYKTRICHYCGIGLDPEAPRGHLCRTTMDHKVPLKRGGSNTRENLVAACWSCNCRKNRKTAEEFLALLMKIGLIGTLRDRSGPAKPRAARVR